MFSWISVFLCTLSTKENIRLLRICLNYYKKFFTFFLYIYKNEHREHKFWRQKNKKKGHLQKQIDDVDVNKILVSKKEPYGTKNTFKYFIGYNDYVIRSLCLRLPQMTGYAKKSNENATMSFRANNKHL